ncbi:MAG TPA: class I SAM-dependent methyltransferase [Acidobacteriota bacterium]|nr:class I SAM-dependent methyltransferase [Acidobacteriota bacterium]
MTGKYEQDLAYIHDQGFGEFAKNAAPGLLKMLREHGIHSGLVVDLGCGSGIWARYLHDHGYEVFGVDQSAAMIQLARRTAPAAKFKNGSLFNTTLPSSVAVTSLGECISYLFDRNFKKDSLLKLFRNVYRALQPGGIFIFDVMESLPYELKYPKKLYKEGKDWAILFAATCDRKQKILTRHMVTYRKIGNHYRRGEEVHRLRVLGRKIVRRELERAGFGVRYLQSYGKMRMMPGRLAFLAQK